MPNRPMSQRELAAALGISASTVNRLMKSGKTAQQLLLAKGIAVNASGELGEDLVLALRIAVAENDGPAIAETLMPRAFTVIGELLELMGMRESWDAWRKAKTQNLNLRASADTIRADQEAHEKAINQIGHRDEGLNPVTAADLTALGIDV